MNKLKVEPGMVVWHSDASEASAHKWPALVVAKSQARTRSPTWSLVHFVSKKEYSGVQESSMCDFFKNIRLIGVPQGHERALIAAVCVEAAKHVRKKGTLAQRNELLRPGYEVIFESVI